MKPWYQALGFYEWRENTLMAVRYKIDKVCASIEKERAQGKVDSSQIRLDSDKRLSTRGIITTIH